MIYHRSKVRVAVKKKEKRIKKKRRRCLDVVKRRSVLSRRGAAAQRVLPQRKARTINRHRAATAACGGANANYTNGCYRECKQESNLTPTSPKANRANRERQTSRLSLASKRDTKTFVAQYTPGLRCGRSKILNVLSSVLRARVSPSLSWDLSQRNRPRKIKRTRALKKEVK